MVLRLSSLQDKGKLKNAPASLARAFCTVKRRETGRATLPPFRYVDKGNMAVIGRGFAILDAGYVKLHGFPAWLVWACVHIAFLPALGNRWRVWTQALWS